MDITVLDGPVGCAASLKMLRSVFQKGMMCLLLESLHAARDCGVEKALLDSLAAILTACRCEARRIAGPQGHG